MVTLAACRGRVRQPGVLRIVVLLAEQQNERSPEGGAQPLGVDGRASETEGIADVEVGHRVGARIGRDGRRETRLRHQNHHPVDELCARRVTKQEVVLAAVSARFADAVEDPLDLAEDVLASLLWSPAPVEDVAGLVHARGSVARGRELRGDQQHAVPVRVGNPGVEILLGVPAYAVHDEQHGRVGSHARRFVDVNRNRLAPLVADLEPVDTWSERLRPNSTRSEDERGGGQERGRHQACALSRSPEPGPICRVIHFERAEAHCSPTQRREHQ